ncbi:hypothetical protein NUV25_32860 [Burkholderia pseudomultivorans]|uniref:hypothetical protein n=1 Tax=Burkholderia pseudomultivorans TaxID=1207504 RepID=UPI0028762742|nr:hypothetical protein [Burkholderia pseudomultivorans]MDS0862504.1 hypothetical protein [Burkholderia pseudomultivorans]
MLIHCSWPSSLWRIEARRNRRQRRQRLVFGRAIQAQEEAPYTRWVHDATGRTFHVCMRDGATTTQRMEPLRLVREHIDRQRRFVLAQAVSATVIDRPTRASSPSVPVSASRLRTHHLPNVSLNWGNFFHGDPGNADAIVCYLMPGVMAKLAGFS